MNGRERKVRGIHIGICACASSKFVVLRQDRWRMKAAWTNLSSLLRLHTMWQTWVLQILAAAMLGVLWWNVHMQ